MGHNLRPTGPRLVRRSSSRLLDFRRIPGANQATVTVDLSVSGDPVQPRLFGNFLEHLGFAIDGGLSAQLLSNPTFTRPSNLTPAQKQELLRAGRILQAYAAGIPLPEGWTPGISCTGFGVAALDDREADGIPFPWAPLELSHSDGQRRDPQRQPGTTAGMVGHAMRLPCPAPGSLSGLRQAVFLPLHRQSAYEGELWVRVAPGSLDRAESSSPIAAKGNGHLQVGFRRRPERGGEVVASAVLAVEPASERWIRLSFRLEVPEAWVSILQGDPAISGPTALRVSEPVDFFMAWEGPWDLAIDQVVLFPVDHVDGLDPEVLEWIARWGVRVLRWPGGNYASGYHWHDGIGPRHLRPTRPNRAWGGLDYNHFGTDEFIALCRRIGAEPQITVNVGSGSPQEAAAWVEYCNASTDTPMGRLRARHGHPEPYNVKLWEIGNEIYAEWQEGFVGAEEYARRYEEFAQAMRAVDPDITLIGCGNCFDFVNPGPAWDFTSADGGWWHRRLLSARPTPDMVSVHALPDNERGLHGLDDRLAHYSLMSHTVAWELVHLPALEQTAIEVAGKPVPIAITEWGILGPMAGRARVENFGGCVYAGLFLNMAIRLGRTIALANATALLHGGCIRKAGGRVYLDPQYLVLQRYADLVGALPVRCVIEGDGYGVGPEYEVAVHPDTGAPVADVPYIDGIACLFPPNDAPEKGAAEPSRVVLCLVNRHLEATIPVHVYVEGFRPLGGRRAEAVTLTGPSVNAVASLDEPERFAWRPLPVLERAVQGSRGPVWRIDVPPISITWATIWGTSS